MRLPMNAPASFPNIVVSSSKMLRLDKRRAAKWFRAPPKQWLVGFAKSWLLGPADQCAILGVDPISRGIPPLARHLNWIGYRPAIQRRAKKGSLR
jgi:hypothetical protein